MSSFPVIIIGAEDSPRLKYFKSSSEVLELLEPEYLNAIMLDSESASIYVNSRIDDFHQTVYGRSLMSSEIGCALSNRLAQNRISKTDIGGLILEDDARFNDLPRLIEVVNEFLSNFAGQKAVLSLYDGRSWNELEDGFRQKHPFVRTLSPSAHTVAYALTPEAAENLVYANRDLRYLADWPASNCIFFTSSLGLINHGDSTTISSIDSSESRRQHPPILRRIQVISGWLYFSKHSAFYSFKEFIYTMWIPRFSHYISVIIFKLLRLRYGRKN